MTDWVALWLAQVQRGVERASQWAARHLQPRIAQELLAERKPIHDARARVHYLVVLAELAKLRKFPEEERQ